MIQNKPNAMASWMKYIYSFHRHVLTYDNQGHRIDLHKKKNPSGFEGYIHKISPMSNRGDRGIRTLDTVSRIHTFQACLFNHSSRSPGPCSLKLHGSRRQK